VNSYYIATELRSYRRKGLKLDLNLGQITRDIYQECPNVYFDDIACQVNQTLNLHLTVGPQQSCSDLNLDLDFTLILL